MIFKELNRGKCKTYLVACGRTRRALLVDPLRDNVERYLAYLAYEGLKLEAVADTHTHADHPTGAFLLNDLTGCRVIMHRRSPVPRVTDYVEDGQEFPVGEITLSVLYTPGHTPDSISLYLGDRVFTGDVLLIGGTGRTDFQGGDAGEAYDSITQRLFALPDSTLVYPAHDYRGNTSSTIGEERKRNPRIAGRSRQEYIDLMNGLKFPLPDKIQEVLQPNQTAIDDDRTKFPDLTQLNEVRQRDSEEVAALMAAGGPLLLLDVREPHEYTDELGHIPNSRLIPLHRLADRVSEIADYRDQPVVCVCRAGVRSTTAAAILTGLGFERVSNLKGGMLEWNERRFPVER